MLKPQFIKEEIKDQYLLDTRPWIIGYSGGKDSSALLQLTWYALRELPKEKRAKWIYVVCNDTLVENPSIVQWIDKSLKNIEEKADREQLPIKVVRTTPDLEDSFWVNLIGKGYPAPNSTFRWCTERLKIKPTSKFIKSEIERSGEVIILLGTREDESNQRKQSMSKFQIDNQRLKRHIDLDLAYVYTPLRTLTTNELWQYLLQVPPPWSINNRDLITLYKNGTGGDCPLVIDSSTPSCGQSRFGCWVCTVVKRDKSMEALIDNGEEWMQPMLDLRDWLVENRDREELRMDKRRNGLPGKGPYTIEVRSTILEMLLKAQILTNQLFITSQELKAIQVLWNMDGFSQNVYEIYNSFYNTKISTQMNNRDKVKAKQSEKLKNICEEHKIDLKIVETLLSVVADKSLLRKRVGIQQTIKNIFEK